MGTPDPPGSDPGRHRDATEHRSEDDADKRTTVAIDDRFDEEEWGRDGERDSKDQEQGAEERPLPASDLQLKPHASMLHGSDSRARWRGRRLLGVEA